MAGRVTAGYRFMAEQEGLTLASADPNVLEFSKIRDLQCNKVSDQNGRGEVHGRSQIWFPSLPGERGGKTATVLQQDLHV